MRRPRTWRVVLAGGVLVASLASAEPAGADNGEVRGLADVIDGDSMVIDGRPVDLYGITAPRFNQQCQADEVSWSCGREAARALDRLVHGHAIVCTPHDANTETAMVARCMIDGRDVAEAMVERGFAVAWKQVEPYATAEQGARALRLGIWRDGDIDPWLWRPDEG